MFILEIEPTDLVGSNVMKDALKISLFSLDVAILFELFILYW